MGQCHNQHDPGGDGGSVHPHNIGLLFLNAVARGALLRSLLQLVSLSTASPKSAIDLADTLRVNKNRSPCCGKGDQLLGVCLICNSPPVGRILPYRDLHSEVIKSDPHTRKSIRESVMEKAIMKHRPHNEPGSGYPKHGHKGVGLSR